MANPFSSFGSMFTRKTVAPTKRAGASGTGIFGGRITENENNVDLTGIRKYKTYSDMLANVSIVSTGVRYFLNLVAGAEWNVNPSDPDSAVSIEFAEKVEKIMADMETPWPRIIRRAAMYRFYGFSIQEWTAKLNDDGVIGFDDIEPRSQQSIDGWDRDEKTGRIVGMIQISPQTQEELYLPRKKMIYIVDDSLSDSPEGLGIFRNLVVATNRLQRYEQLEGYAFETDLAGIPIARAPFAELRALEESGEITKDVRNDIEQPLRDFLNKRVKNPQLGLYLDSATYRSNDDGQTPSSIRQWDLELLKTSSQAQDAVAHTIERLTGEIARMLNIEGLLLGSRDQGSQALSTDKSKNTSLIVDSTLMDLEHGFQKDFINPIWKLNGWPEDMKPKFKTEATQFKDPEMITRALADLASAGSPMAIDDPADADVRKLIKVSPKPKASQADLMLMGALPNLSTSVETDGTLSNKGSASVDINDDMGNDDND